MIKYLCIKEVIISDHKESQIIKYKNFFIKNYIYDFIYDKEPYIKYNYCHISNDNYYRLSNEEIKNFFILDRGYLIDKILEN